MKLSTKRKIFQHILHLSICIKNQHWVFQQDSASAHKANQKERMVANQFSTKKKF